MTERPATLVHEIFRCVRGTTTRVYNLHVVPGGTELWRVTLEPGGAATSVKETDLRDAGEAAAFIAEVERTLQAGGWRVLSGDD